MSKFEEWEDVHDEFDGDDNLLGDTQRMKVLNGYLYRTRIIDGGRWHAVAMCFVPYHDPHE